MSRSGEETLQGVGRVVTRTRPVEDVGTRAFLRAFDPPLVCWSAPGEPTVVGAGAAAVVAADPGDRFGTVRAAADDLFAATEARPAHPEPARPRLLGGFSFHDDHAEADPWRGFGGARFYLPAVQLTRGDRTWLTVSAVDPAEGAVGERLEAAARRVASLPSPADAGDPAPPPGVTDRRRTTSRTAWRRQVRDALDRIGRGDLRKVVLAQALSADLGASLSAPDALARLGRVYPDCHHFLVRPSAADPDAPGLHVGGDLPDRHAGGGHRRGSGPGVDHLSNGSGGHGAPARSPVDGGPPGSFFGATPERLVSLSGRTVTTEALAGSTGRGETPEEDEWLASELAASEKDRQEHEMVVEAIRDQLSPFASSVGVGPRDVRRLATVQHLRTPVSAELGDSEHVLSLVSALHPTPAVGGLPPDGALSTIRETEAFERGWYAAPVGWFDAAGNGSFAVAIRSAVGRDRRVTCFAGAGIVADSDPDREWDEVQLKYRPVLDAIE